MEFFQKKIFDYNLIFGRPKIKDSSALHYLSFLLILVIARVVEKFCKVYHRLIVVSEPQISMNTVTSRNTSTIVAENTEETRENRPDRCEPQVVVSRMD